MINKQEKQREKRGFFSVYEWLLLVLGHLLILLAFIISPLVGADASILSTVTSMVGVWGIIMISRGSYVSHYIYIVFSVMYSVVAITAGYYGEAIIYTGMMLPIHIFSAVSWKKDQTTTHEKEVQVTKITKGHIVLSAVVCVLLSVPFYFLLVALNTKNPICSTLSLSTSVLAAYFMLRRVKFFPVIFAMDDLFLLLLWGIQIGWGEYEYLPTLIVCFTSLVNDVYSAVCWAKRAKKRKEQMR